MIPAICKIESLEDEVCIYCLSKFQSNERLTKLACNHFFHENCFPEFLTNCPTCRHEVFVFTENNLNELVQAVDELFEQIFGLTQILTNSQKQKAREWLLAEMVTFYSDDNHNPAVTAKKLKDINLAWTVSDARTEKAFQNLTTRHADFLAKFCERHFANTPVGLDFDLFFSDLEKGIRDLKKIQAIAQEQEKGMLQYGITLFEKFSQNEKVKNLFKKKEAEFIAHTKEHLRVLENNQRLRHLFRMNPKQRKLLDACPDAHISIMALSQLCITFWK